MHHETRAGVSPCPVYGAYMERAFRPERLAVPDPAPRPLPGYGWLIAALVMVALAAGGVHLKPAGVALAAWWPAAGVAVWLMLRAGRDSRWRVVALVLVVTAIGNALGGRDLLHGGLLGAGNALETLIVSLMLHRSRPTFRMSTARDALRFVLACAVGGLAAGFWAAGALALFPGGTGLLTLSFLDTALRATASHVSTVLLIASFAVVPRHLSDAAPRAEMVTQTALVSLTVAFVFAPGMDLPLSFLPFAFIVWAAFRFPVHLALTEALVASVAVLALTIAGGGPFSNGGLNTSALVLVVELYMIVLGVITIMMIAARYEAREATRTSLSVSQLITGGFVASRVGLIIAAEDHGAITVLWANRAAVSAIDAELAPDGVWSGPLARNALTSIEEGIEVMHEDLDAGTTISVLATRIPGDITRFSAQLVDVGATIRAAQAHHDAERERAAAHSTLVDLERQRDDFVATTSHELRTPVTSIAGYAELLSESAALSSAERSWVQIIIRNTARLTTLVEDLLTLGRSGIPAASLEPLSLRGLAGEVLDVERPMADARRIRLVLAVDQDAVAHCAADDAARALGNLISNAVKFTPPGGTVRVATAEHDGRIALAVSDTGPGMPAESLAQAFDRFYRGHDAVQANTPGTGLGLAIARQLAERNGGTVRLECPPSGGLVAVLVFADAVGRGTADIRA